LKQHCKGLNSVGSSSKKPHEDSWRPIKTNSVDAGAIPKRNRPFAFYGECNAVEWWDGIGGEMGLGKENQAVARKPRRTGTRKKAVSRGTAKMKAAASKALENNSEKIAKSLLDGTLKGNVISAKLLIALAEEQADCEEKEPKQRGYSLAEKLASESEWIGEAAGAKAETGFDQQKPKC
jgi:hypothetical protein